MAIITANLLLLCLFASASALNLTDGDYIINFVNSGQSTWKAHHNFKRDSLPHYAMYLAGGGNSHSSSTSHGGIHAFETVNSESDNNTIPDEFDAREAWPNCSSIGQVRDQGPCSSGWAIASVTALSDRFCIASNGTIKVDLSAQELLECCGVCGDCNSGDAKFVWYYIAFNGIITGGDYKSHKGCKPYEIAPCDHSIFTSMNLKSCASMKTPKIKSCRKKCTVKKYRGKYATDVHFVKVVKPLSTETTIQQAILESGPVQATITVYEDMLYYKSGVYSHTIGNKMGSQSVKIIGWGVEGDDDKTPYWLVVNSWNTNWGENGLLKIVRGSNEGGIETYAYSPIPDLSV